MTKDTDKRQQSTYCPIITFRPYFSEPFIISGAINCVTQIRRRPHTNTNSHKNKPGHPSQQQESRPSTTGVVAMPLRCEPRVTSTDSCTHLGRAHGGVHLLRVGVVTNLLAAPEVGELCDGVVD